MRARRGFTLLEVLIGLLLTVLVLTAVWRIYLSMTRQDAATRLMADRLQTLALVQRQLARDLEPRCAKEPPVVEDGGRALLIRAYDAPRGPADGPRGSGEIRWEFEARTGALVRNGRVVGMKVVSGATFELAAEPAVAALRVVVRWAAVAGVDASAGCWSRIAHAWPLAARRGRTS